MNAEIVEPFFFNPSFVIPLLYASLAFNVILVFMWCRLIIKIRKVCNIITENSKVIVDNSVKVVSEPSLEDSDSSESSKGNTEQEITLI